MVTDGDLTAAILIALLLVVVALCAWPGLLRLHGRDLAGFWATPGGGLYEIRAAEGRAFEIREPGRAGGRPPAQGRLTGVRHVKVSGGPGAVSRAGVVEAGGRRIRWKKGDTW